MLNQCEVILKVDKEEVKMIRNVKMFIKIDQYYTSNGGANNSNISKNNINTYK